MKPEEYWQDRFLELEKASNEYGLQTCRKISPTFEKAAKEIQEKIQAWYLRYAANNKITMAEAKRQLSTKELKEFRWDVNDYIKYGKENAIDRRWMKQLENASARVHISRLEALLIRTQQAAERAIGNELDQLDEMARKVFTQDYYHACYEIQKGLGVGWDIGTIDTRKLDTLITKPWAADGKNFSQRIWQQRDQLVAELHNQLTRTCVMGKAPDDAIKAISKRFDVTKNQAGRLVMTEQAYFHSVAQQNAFDDLEVEAYEIVATLDSHTSPTCREMDGKTFPMKEYKAGVTAPPFHVWCRSVTAPYFDDDVDSQRAARDIDGKTYYVPASMKYPDWKKAFVDGGSKADLDIFDIDKAELCAKLKSLGMSDKQASFISDSMDALPAGSREKEIWCEVLETAPYDVHEGAVDSAFTVDGKVRFSSDQDDPLTVIHEIAHWKDHGSIKKIAHEGKSWSFEIKNGSEWVKHKMESVDGRKPYFEDLTNIADQLNLKLEGDGYYRLWFENENDAPEAYASWVKKFIIPKYKVDVLGDNKGFDSVSDILSGFTNDAIAASVVYGGHPTSYWFQDAKLFYAEAWADFCMLKVSRNQLMLDLLKSLTPNLYKNLDEVYNEVFEVGKKAIKNVTMQRIARVANVKPITSLKKQRKILIHAQKEVLSNYDIPNGVTNKQVLEFINDVGKIRLEGFYESDLNNQKDLLHHLRFEGNGAIMLVDGRKYFSHSAIDDATSIEFKSYIGHLPLVTKPKKNTFKFLKVDGYYRDVDTEYKLLSYIAVRKKRSDVFNVVLFTEKAMCESCENVVKQFKRMFPNAKVTVIQGKSDV